MRLRLFIVCSTALLLAACASKPPAPESTTERRPDRPTSSSKGHDVVIFALGLIDTGYRFGGKNPEAGLDCSGMVSYVFDKAAGLRLKGSAADIAQHGRSVSLDEIKPGDLVFFNTRQRPHSHVGIYIGDGRFVHAPNSKGSVRAESLYTGWFASRFEEARSYLE